MSNHISRFIDSYKPMKYGYPVKSTFILDSLESIRFAHLNATSKVYLLRS